MSSTDPQYSFREIKQLIRDGILGNHYMLKDSRSDEPNVIYVNELRRLQRIYGTKRVVVPDNVTDAQRQGVIELAGRLNLMSEKMYSSGNLCGGGCLVDPPLLAMTLSKYVECIRELTPEETNVKVKELTNKKTTDILEAHRIGRRLYRQDEFPIVKLGHKVLSVDIDDHDGECLLRLSPLVLHRPEDVYVGRKLYRVQYRLDGNTIESQPVDSPQIWEDNPVVFYKFQFKLEQVGGLELHLPEEELTARFEVADMVVEANGGTIYFSDLILKQLFGSDKHL